ncbi:hypothetical protein [Pseudodesulfovibrio pelocollis]|uniref:hypothetical protein n=1 Tax=Pseudodesulfovibrio pelocollis TaxID=3051432 RepID=UPI00255A7B1B|nr:hypothetical protein [Pseudodesulfovibrio sp. SB368]
MTNPKMPLEISFLIRSTQRSRFFDPQAIFEDKAKAHSLEFVEGPCNEVDLFEKTLALAALLDESLELNFWEGFYLTKQRIAKRHFWINYGERHISIKREDATPETLFWGIRIPEAILTVCTLSAPITTSRGCLDILATFPDHELEQLT